MSFRKLNQQEILDALHLIWEVYADETAPHRNEQQVEEFRASIRYESVLRRYACQELQFFGDYDGELIAGAAAVDMMGKIIFFAVKDSMPDRAARFMDELRQYSVQTLRTAALKIDAQQDKAAYFHKLGFRQSGKEYMKNGILVFPMESFTSSERYTNPGSRQNPNDTGASHNKKNTGLIVGIIVAAVLGLILICSLIGFGVYKYGAAKPESFRERIYGDDFFNNGNNPYEDDTDEDNGYYDDYDSQDDQTDGTGIQSIEEYEADNLSYSVKETSFNERKSEGKYQMDFLVKYPELTGLPAETSDIVNQAIKDCALQTANEIYLNPTEETKEALLQENMPYLVSYVDYKITYASDDFLSVVLEDRYYKGDISKEYGDLRSVNINLKTGQIYKVKDIVTLSDEYMADWKKRMIQEAPGVNVLNLIPDADYKKALSGDSSGGIYLDTFFVDSEGMEIGLSFHYKDQDAKSRQSGWVTAPYTIPEASAHKTDSDFWTLIQ